MEKEQYLELFENRKSVLISNEKLMILFPHDKYRNNSYEQLQIKIFKHISKIELAFFNKIGF